MSDTDTCLNKHSDFSVQPKPTHYEACGNMASLKLQGDSNLKEEAAALLKIEEAAVEDPKNLEAFSQASLTKDIPLAPASDTKGRCSFKPIQKARPRQRWHTRKLSERDENFIYNNGVLPKVC